ncbi:hypothetical protein BH11ARM1_BH11ARM1_11180 [soil metagenome]
MASSPAVTGTSSRGVLSLVLGILSFLGFSILTGIPAWIIAHGYIKEVEAGRTDPAELGMAKGGKILGMVSVALGVIGLIIALPLYSLLLTASVPRTFGGADIEATHRREALAAQVVGRRTAHERPYAFFAKELSGMNGYRTDWGSPPLAPPWGCGTYTFKAGDGKLVITDGCGSTTLSGWPANILSQ